MDNCNFLISLPTEGSGDAARKISLKYKKTEALEARYGASVVNSPDSSYGSLPAEPDIPQDELFRL